MEPIEIVWWNSWKSCMSRYHCGPALAPAGRESTAPRTAGRPTERGHAKTRGTGAMERGDTLEVFCRFRGP